MRQWARPIQTNSSEYDRMEMKLWNEHESSEKLEADEGFDLQIDIQYFQQKFSFTFNNTFLRWGWCS